MTLRENLSSVVTKVTDYFSSYPSSEVSATSSATASNPIYKAVEDLNGRWRERQTEGFTYVAFGRSDDVPEIIDKLKAQSTTHSGIINKKAKMVYGNAVTYEESSIDAGQKKRFEAFYKHCMGRNKGVRRFIMEAASSYEKYGAVPVLVRYGESGRMVSMRVLSANSVRATIPTDDGTVKRWVVKRTFKRGTEGLSNNKPRLVDAYDGKAPSNKEQLLYISNPDSGNPIYGLPSYLSAYYFISADYEFGKHIENSVKNGFTPKVIATFIGRNMSQEQKDEEYRKFTENFTGSDAEMVILNWIKKKEDQPEFKTLDVANLDRTIKVLSEMNDSKILTAHSVTSPTLFGIQVAGKLGGTGTEMVAAYDTFRATETLPNREIIMGSLNEVMSTSGYGKNIELTIEDIVITAEGADGIATPEEGKPDSDGVSSE